MADLITRQAAIDVLDRNHILGQGLLNDTLVKLKCIHFAFDRYQDKKVIMRNLKLFKDKTGYNKDKGRIMVYILCNYDTNLSQDIERIQFCRELRFSPYPMIYDKEHADPIYRDIQRWCNNFIFWKVPTFEQYKGGIWTNDTT